MADDFAFSAKEKALEKNPIAVAECLVDIHREIQNWGLGRVDDREAISEDLVRQTIPKCRPLQTRYRRPDVQTFSKIGHGHGGLIRHQILQSSPGGTTTTKYSVTPVTAKHNLRQFSSSVSGHSFHATAAELLVKGGVVSICSEDLDFAKSDDDIFDLREGLNAIPALTEWGIDISVGAVITELDNPAANAQLSFDKVRPTFQLEKGQRVGMAIMFSEESKPTRETIAGAFDDDEADISTEDIERIFGKPGKVNIYTGEIKYVGLHHIEYDINAFTSCSGACVFLLDKNQPDSVDSADWGKVVAIHSGAHPTLGDRNFGFKINSHSSFADR